MANNNPEAPSTQSVDELMKLIGKTPLFMTSEDVESEENDVLEGIKALQYEGTPLENAQNFNEQGREMVQEKRWSDGKEFYTKGLDILRKSRLDRKAQKDPPEVSDEIAKEANLEEVCFVNRAFCNLQLKNYRSTTLDCAQALRHNPRNVKAFYRSSLALLALDKIDEAIDACNHGLAIETSNASMKALSGKIEARRQVLATINENKRAQVERERKIKATLTTALKKRNIRVRRTSQPPDLEDATIHLEPDPLSLESSLCFPLLLLYPLHAQSDFIKAVSEVDTIQQHLEYIFPLPWDQDQEYTINLIDIYMETSSAGLIKVGKNLSLSKVLANDQVEVVDDLVNVNIVPKAKASGWITEMKARSQP